MKECVVQNLELGNVLRPENISFMKIALIFPSGKKQYFNYLYNIIYFGMDRVNRVKQARNSHLME